MPVLWTTTLNCDSFFVASAEQSAGREMIERLQTESEIPLIALQRELEMLRIYCKERLNSELRGLVTYQASRLMVHRHGTKQASENANLTEN